MALTHSKYKQDICHISKLAETLKSENGKVFPPRHPSYSDLLSALGSASSLKLNDEGCR